MTPQEKELREKIEKLFDEIESITWFETLSIKARFYELKRKWTESFITDLSATSGEKEIIKALTGEEIVDVKYTTSTSYGEKEEFPDIDFHKEIAEELSRDELIERLCEMNKSYTEMRKEWFDKCVMAEQPIQEAEKRNNEGLLPCPFCGNYPIWVGKALHDGQYRLRCERCQFTIMDDRKDKVFGQWNERFQSHSEQPKAPVSAEEMINIIEAEIELYTMPNDLIDYHECALSIYKKLSSLSQSKPEPTKITNDEIEKWMRREDLSGHLFSLGAIAFYSPAYYWVCKFYKALINGQIHGK